ncbi:MAG TPA: glycosyltransferase, partial [archaeon]|nr:glycosyltransferase [archaeon]
MAKKFKKISFVIPALNEEKTIAKTLKEIPKRQLRKAGLETEVVVVDSNSTDDTVKIARALGARVVNEPRKGYGLANLKGF